MSDLLTFWGTWVHVSVSILGLLLYLASTHTLKQHRHPTAALSWILSFLFVPYLALPAYVFFGQRKIRPATLNAADIDTPLGVRHWMSAMLETLGASPARAAADIGLHEDAPAARDALWTCIDQAIGHVHVSTYLLRDDEMGRELVRRLAQAADRGVRVRLLIDGVGCLLVRNALLRPLIDSGGQVARAFPPLRRLLRTQSNFRNHRKYLVADGVRLWMGGRNFGDEYFEGSASQPGWLDLTLDACGALAADADRIFARDWLLATGQALPAMAAKAVDGSDAQLLGSGPDQAMDSLDALLVTATFRARRRILICTPYLIPDPALQQAICLAALRRVSVDVILPRRTNHWLADQARARALRALTAAGVRVWLTPRMNHAKAAVFDDIAMCGSANMDARSLFLNFEITLVIYRRDTAAAIASWIERRRGEGRRFVPRPASIARDMFEGAVLWLGFQL